VIARFGEWTFDSDRRLVTDARGEVVHLTPKAFDLLSALIEQAPRVVRKVELHRRLWPGVFVSDATLAGLVKEVRRALRDVVSGQSLIRTSHGVGYAFAGGAEHRPSERDRTDYWLIIEGRRIHLEDAEIVIGRDPASAVRLDAAGVSRRHARIVIRDRGAYLEDLGSKNGTRLGAWDCVGSAALHDGDTIWLGPVSIVFRASSSDISTETTIPPATD
jgi:DNA-binding winged helix-turn-helix (wHTH) protein